MVRMYQWCWQAAIVKVLFCVKWPDKTVFNNVLTLEWGLGSIVWYSSI